MAEQACAQGPRGFSLALIRMASGGTFVSGRTLWAKAKSASVVMRARTTAEAADAILTKFLRVTRNPFGRAGVSRFIGSSPRKVAVAHTCQAVRLCGCSIP